MRLLTIDELASKATPKSTLSKWAREHKIPAFKIGKKWVIKEEDWNNFIQKEREAYISPLSKSDQLTDKKAGQDEV